ncbi:IS200/IS605 family transposase ISHhu3 [subsurface metagenome]
MLVEKTVKAKVIAPTNRKQELLDREYQSFQYTLYGGEANLYSATKQQAERFLRKIKTPKHRHYPLILRRDVIRLERQETKVAPYWFKFPVFGVRGGIWLGLKPHCDIPVDCSLREAKLIRRKNAWFIHLTIQKEVPESIIDEHHILAVDLGERYLATVCGNNGTNPQFLGKEVRGIRRHYAWIRKRLGERKLLNTTRKVGHTEQKKVNDICHQISRRIVNEARETDSVIILGDLKGIRKNAKGKRMNRIVSNMPCYKLTQFIKYKAAWDGVPVLVISEAYTSKGCHRCGSLGSRPYRGLFLCHSCKLHYNADLNGARNILKRALDYMSSAGAALAQPVTQSLN